MLVWYQYRVPKSTIMYYYMYPVPDSTTNPAFQPQYPGNPFGESGPAKKISRISTLINKVRENVEIREIENIQLPFRTHGNVLFRTCYRMYSCVKFKHIFLFLPKIFEIHKKGPGGFIGEQDGRKKFKIEIWSPTRKLHRLFCWTFSTKLLPPTSPQLPRCSR